MDLMNTLSWWQWAILLALPPAIIALYFLKLKRQPLEVPSTYLWQKSIEDLHVNSIWQRLRQNLLLVLQLLLLLIVMLALLRPGCRSYALEGERFIFLIDNSASMSATDVLPSRLDEAKRQALALIDQMESGQQAMVVSFADEGQVRQTLTGNRQQLRSAVESIEPTVQRTSLASTLQLVAGVTAAGRAARGAGEELIVDAVPAELFIFSDGRFPPVTGVSLGSLKPNYIPIGKPSPVNYAITAFSTRRHESKPDEQQAFAQIENFSAEEALLTLELYLDEVLVDADEVSIPAGESRGMTFDLSGIETGVLRLELSAEDDLPTDNRAYAILDAPRRAQVLLVTPGNDPLEFALATDRAQQLADVQMIQPEALAGKDYQLDAESGRFDLIIYDQCRPPAMPMSNTLLIGRLPPEDSDWKLAAEEPAAVPVILDTNRSHPLMQLIDLGNIEIAESLLLKPPVGSQSLIDSPAGTICAIAPRGGFEDLVLGFEIVGRTEQGGTYANTNWPLRLSFPTFVLSAIEYLGGDEQRQRGISAQPGEVVTLRPQGPVDRVRVSLPDGSTQTVPVAAGGSVHFSGTTQLGVYEFLESDQPPRRLAVNLLDAHESHLAPQEEAVQVGYVEIEGKRSWEPGRRETWKWFLLAALAVLLVEWYIYNRRVYF